MPEMRLAANGLEVRFFPQTAKSSSSLGPFMCLSRCSATIRRVRNPRRPLASWQYAPKALELCDSPYIRSRDRSLITTA